MPSENAAMAFYEAELKAGRFMIQRCSNCARHIFYPRAICPHCAGTDLEWQQAKGTGQVYSTTVVRRPADKGGPYNVALIDLDENVRLMSRVDGLAPEAVKIGQRVRLSIAEIKGVPAPVFHPIDGAIESGAA